MKYYDKPELEIVEFEFEVVDTLTVSEVSDGTNEDNYVDPGTPWGL